MNEPPNTSSTEPSARRRVSPKAIAAVATAVLGGIVFAVVLLNLPRGETGGADGSTSPSATVAPGSSTTAMSEPSASPSATPQPTPTPRPAGAAPMTWTPGTPPDGSVVDLAWIGDRWLAAGSITEEGNRPRAATWTSVDGLTWEPGAPIGPDPVPGPEGMSYFMQDVLVVGDELIGFGWNHIGCCDGGKAALWRSTDGVSWTFVDTSGTDYGDTYHGPADSAVAPTGELVLLSWTGLGEGSTVFTSTDGTTWVEQPIDGQGVGFAGVAASDATLMAVGQLADFSSDPSTMVWASLDGHTWTAATPPPGAAVLNAVAWDALSERFVVVGRDADGRPAAWLTSDGASWATTILADAGYVASVSAADGLIVAAGLVGEAPDDDLIAWSSLDGVTWQVQPLADSISGGPLVATAGEEAVLFVNGLGPEPDLVEISQIWAGTLAR